MKRSEPLRGDPEKIRAWQDRTRASAVERARGREGMRSAGLRAASSGDFRDDDGKLMPVLGIPIKPTVPDQAPPRSGFRHRPTIPKEVRRMAFARSGGLCIVCLFRCLARGPRTAAAKRATQLHHVLPVQKWPEFIKTLENLVGVCPGCHDEHERAHRRIPRAALPACAIELAVRHELGWFIERTYPE